jgi:hypothetical protein
MPRDVYREPASVEPDPTTHDRLLARVRSGRPQRPDEPRASDAYRYDRESMRGDTTALIAGFVAVALLAATIVIFFVERQATPVPDASTGAVAEPSSD